MQVASIQNIQWLNHLLSVDKTRNPDLIYGTVYEWTKEGWSLQNIEKTLRENKCFTYLIAKKEEASSSLPDGSQKTYSLFISTLVEQQAQIEMQKESKNYDDNFTKLKDSGFQDNKLKAISENIRNLVQVRIQTGSSNSCWII